MNANSLMSGDVNEVATLLIPMSGKQWVLPNVTVAEIIPYDASDIETDTEKAEWLIGFLNWRQIKVPLVDMGKLNNEESVSTSSDQRVAILNGIVDGQRLPFCAVMTSGVPRLLRLLRDEIVVNEAVEAGPAEVTGVLASGESAIIPDVDWIQQQVLGVI